MTLFCRLSPQAFAGMLVESSLLWKPVAAAAGGQELQQPDY